MSERGFEPMASFFEQRDWRVFDFQKQAWDAYLAGRDGLIYSATGSGKTLAAIGGPLIEAHEGGGSAADGAGKRRPAAPLTVLWVTPLRALAYDTLRNLQEVIDHAGVNWSIEMRTGDVSSSVKRRQLKRLPSLLLTTPESMELLLSYPGGRERLGTLKAVVVDEWHELLGNKRGTMAELSLAHLRSLCPAVRIWGLSATLANLEQAARALVGVDVGRTEPLLVRGPSDRPTEVCCLLPEAIERFPWSGHLGIRLLDQVIERLECASSSLLFTNTRSQAELWYRTLISARPDWIGQVALHHGSLDVQVRREVERLLIEQRLKAVVCTSSLDLGVDFGPVEQVLQVGSPKGIARLLQRAGRSNHRPDGVSRVVGVPTHAFELIEFAAAGRAIGKGDIEPRMPVELALDVLAQHLVTLASGDGFEPEQVLREVRSTAAFAALTDEQFRWVLAFVQHGGDALGAYDRFVRVREQDGVMRAASPRVERTHRLGIGTIVSDQSIQVRYLSGRVLGTVEESFAGRLSPGDRFVFGGKLLELVRVREMAAWVKTAKGRKARVPRWAGTKFPLSSELAGEVLEQFEQAAEGRFKGEIMGCVRPLLELQQHVSELPSPDRLLIEQIKTAEGEHLFIYPFEGRLVNEGLASLFAYRSASWKPGTFSVNFNDYGLELIGDERLLLDEAMRERLFATDRLADDLIAGLNTGELARRQFREIARIAGLISVGPPGRAVSNRYLQASSELFYDVLQEFDPGNLLLDQARREVLERQMDYVRLRSALERMGRMPVTLTRPSSLTPLSFPLWADRLREQMISTEKWQDRIAKAAAKLEKAADQALARGQGIAAR